MLLQDPPVGEVPKGSRVERRWKVSPSYVTYQEQAREEAASQEGASIVARIHRLLKSKPDGITGKDLAWLAADLNVEIGPIEAAIKSMGDAVEMVKENGENILRTKAEPGSREELKRTKITDNPLFPNMDRPDHA